MSAAKNEVAKQAEQNAALVVNNAFIDGLSSQLKQKQQYGLTFPADYNATNALMGAYLTLKETTDKNNKCVLETCSQTSIANSLMDMVTMGLNVQKKQGYFIAYGGKCQFQKSYFGNTTIARRYGMKSINADVIYEGDTFKYHKQNAVTVIDEHTQDFLNIDNDKIIGAYAVATMEDGTVVSEIMNIKQLKQAWNQKQGGYKEAEYDTHVKFREEMSKKTVSNRLLKRIINTYGDGYVSETSDKVDEISNADTVAEDVAYDIDTQANSEDFIEDAEVVEQPQKEPNKATQQATEKVAGEVVDDKQSGTPDWMNQ